VTVPDSALATAQFFEHHAPSWLPMSLEGQISGLGQPAAYAIVNHAPRNSPQLTIEVAPIAAGEIGFRADASHGPLARNESTGDARTPNASAHIPGPAIDCRSMNGDRALSRRRRLSPCKLFAYGS
jgi:hypothetical protein